MKAVDGVPPWFQRGKYGYKPGIDGPAVRKRLRDDSLIQEMANSMRAALPGYSQCRFCGGPGIYRCAWKTRLQDDLDSDRPDHRHSRTGAQTRIPFSQVRTGDVLRSQDGRQLRVALIAQGSYPGDLIVVFHGLMERYRYFATNTIELVPPGICNKHCCESCSMERDEKFHICRDHWAAWEKVA